ncbi:MAG TPA: hypothetical protein VG839_09890 [Asticcacaulis sp.]|nr:hypothetical protein [Asticcacaulis sp.]
MKIIIELPTNRTQYGRLRLVDGNGNDLIEPVPAIGRADPSNWPNNPNSDPLLPGGNTPTGGYDVTGLRPPNDSTDASRHGTNGKLELRPTSGQALQAAAVRDHLQIHGGYLNSAGNLRPTSGCIRVSDSSMKTLLDAMSAHEEAVGQCEVVTAEVTDVGTAAMSCEEPPDDPPSALGNLLPVPHAPSTPSNPSPPQQPGGPAPTPPEGPVFPGHQEPSPTPMPPAPPTPTDDDNPDDDDDDNSDDETDDGPGDDGPGDDGDDGGDGDGGDGDGGDGGGGDGGGDLLSLGKLNEGAFKSLAYFRKTKPYLYNFVVGNRPLQKHQGLPRLSSTLLNDFSLIEALVSQGLFAMPRYGSFQSGEKGYRWRFDLRRPLSDGKILAPVAAHIGEIIQSMGVYQIAGRGFGAFPLLGAIGAIHTDIRLGFVRETRKAYGFQRWIEGELDPDAPICIVDDFINRGLQTAKTWQILRHHGFDPSFAACVCTTQSSSRLRILGGRANPVIALIDFQV